ncbi:MAG: heme exporter protein CcmD [Proteobacteria bacterium]|nr:heme exporter protein CcmD [Pseudomonadota bacterium]
MSIQEFFHMGGYGFYVWSSYGLTAIVLIFNVIQSLTLQRKTLRELNNRLRRLRERNDPA